MAAAVARVFADGGVLLAEAGTGTGKTLAYLVPAILSRERVLISTGTKNLQEQIYFKDIPALRDALGDAVHRHLHEGPRQLPVPAQARSAERRRRPCRRTTCSCRSSANGRLAPTPAIAPSWRTCRRTSPFWHEVSATAETCLGTECPRYDDCFVTRMRQRAAASDVVIVNHHLLCADAAVRQNAYGEVIPACSHAILDEAHQLEDIATQYFGFSVSTYRIEDLARDIERLAATGGVEDRAPRRYREGDRAPAGARPRVLHRARVRAPQRRPGDERRAGARHDRRRLVEADDAAASLTGALDLLESILALLRKPTAPDDDDDEPTDESARTPPRWLGAPAKCATTCGSCCAATTTGVRLFRRVPRPRHLPARLADRCLGDRPRTAARPDADDGADVGDADGRRGVRLHPRAAGHPRRPTRSGCRRSSISASRRSSICRRECRTRDRDDFAVAAEPRGDRDPEAHAGPRVRAVHQLRDAARGAGDGGDGARLSDAGRRERRRDRSCSTSSARRRTPCCSRPRASGRAWTSSARR